jgi:hypothetical protein
MATRPPTSTGAANRRRRSSACRITGALISLKADPSADASFHRRAKLNVAAAWTLIDLLQDAAVASREVHLFGVVIHLRAAHGAWHSRLGIKRELLAAGPQHARHPHELVQKLL